MQRCVVPSFDATGHVFRTVGRSHARSSLTLPSWIRADRLSGSVHEYVILLPGQLAAVVGRHDVVDAARYIRRWISSSSRGLLAGFSQSGV